MPGLLGVANKPDSVEICFVPSGNHVDVVRERRGDMQTAGSIVERDGKVLGQHDGIDRFTVGQRKGLGVATGQRRFVLDIVPESNTVIVGDANDLLSDGLSASRMNWLIDLPENPLKSVAKIRYRHAGCSSSVQASSDGTATVWFDTPQSAVAPGQALTLYDGTRVLGGGWIEQRLNR